MLVDPKYPPETSLYLTLGEQLASERISFQELAVSNQKMQLVTVGEL